MKTTSRKRRARVPEALTIALAQVADALKTSGTEKLAELLGAKDGAGYPQVIWVLEKLSNASLEWEELKQQPQDAVKNQPGISSETQQQFESKLEAMK